MRNLSFLMFASLIFYSCSEQTTNPSSPSIFSITSTSEMVNVFPGETTVISLAIISTEIDIIHPIFRDTVSNYFKISGPWFNGQQRDKIYFGITGYKAMPNPATVILPVILGTNSSQATINLKVSDFYLANSFSTNVPSDTINIQRGGTFLLSITCHDTSGRVTPKAQIDRLNVNRGCSWYEGSYNPKMSVTDTNKDTVNYYFILSTFPDIIASDDDRFREFTFILSNKRYTLPIKINY